MLRASMTLRPDCSASSMEIRARLSGAMRPARTSRMASSWRTRFWLRWRRALTPWRIQASSSASFRRIPPRFGASEVTRYSRTSDLTLAAERATLRLSRAAPAPSSQPLTAIATADSGGSEPSAESLANASPEAVEEKISTIGMFRQKARNVTKLAKMLVERHGGEVPRTLDELVELPGVGRKTANVVLGVAFGAPEGVVVDTHVQRLAQRLGFTKETEPERIEKALCEKLPRDVWDITSHTLIFHGRRVCFARKPACATCSVNTLCPSAFEAEEVGRKPKRVRGTRAEEAVPKARATATKTSKPKKVAPKAAAAPRAAKKR